MTKEGNQKFPGPVYWKLPGPVKKPSSPLRYKLLIISRCNTIFFHGFQVLYFYGSIQCAKAYGKMTALSTNIDQHRKILYLLWQNKEIFILSFTRSDKKQHLHGK